MKKSILFIVFIPLMAFPQKAYNKVEDLKKIQSFSLNTISEKSSSYRLDSIYNYHFNSPSDSVLDGRTYYNYNSSGYKTLESLNNIDDQTNQWFEKNRYEYTYDSIGNNISLIQNERIEYHQRAFTDHYGNIVGHDTIIKYYQTEKYRYDYNSSGKQISRKEYYLTEAGTWSNQYWTHGIVLL